MSKFMLRRIIALTAVLCLLLQVIGPSLGAANTFEENNGEPELAIDAIPGEVIVQYAPQMSIMGLRSSAPETEVVVVPEGKSIEEVVASYAEDPNVLFAEPNYIVRAASSGADPRIAEQWALGAIKAPIVWAQHGEALKDAQPVVVAVLDTGIDTTHEDLAGVLLTGRSFARYRNDYTLYADLTNYMDDHGHGTHVTGVIGAVHGNGIGVSGVVGPCATRILPIKVLNDNAWGTVFDLAEGIKYAADQGARVINLSLTVYEYSNTLGTAIRYAQDKGALVVAAIGRNYHAYPASFPGVVAVGAVDSQKYNHWQSSSSEFLDLMAPGADVLSTGLNSSYTTMSGTSVAAAHVSGAAALFRLINPAATQAEVAKALTSTAEDLGDEGWDEYTGHGLLDVQSLVGFGQIQSPRLSLISPLANTTLSGKVSLEVEVINPATVTEVRFYVGSTLLAQVAKASANQNYFTYEWDTKNVADGEYTIYAQAYNNTTAVGEIVTVDIKTWNEPETGFVLRVLAPNGAEPTEAQVTILRRISLDDPNYYSGNDYEEVYEADIHGGVIRLPGTVALDYHDHVVVVQGSFDVEDHWAGFVYVRELEGPTGMVLDGSDSIEAEFSMLGLNDEPLLYPIFTIRPKDSLGVPLMAIPFEVKTMQHNMLIYLSSGEYDTYAFWSSYHAEEMTDFERVFSGPTYFLSKEGLVVDQGTTTVEFNTTNASTLRGKIHGDSSQKVYLSLWKDEIADVLRYPVNIDGEEIVVTAGHYELAANTQSSNYWYYNFRRNEGVTVVAGETPVDIVVGGDFTLKGELENSAIKQGGTLTVRYWGEDSYGYTITSIKQGQYWAQAEYVHMETFDQEGNNRVYHGGDRWPSYTLQLSRSISREPGSYQVRLYTSGGSLFNWSTAYTDYLTFTIESPTPVTTKAIQIYDPAGNPARRNLSAYIYSFVQDSAGWHWSWNTFFYTDINGKIHIPQGLGLSPYGNLIIISEGTQVGSYLYAKEITSLDNLEELRLSECSVELTVNSLDREGQEAYLNKQIVLYTSGDNDTMHRVGTWSIQDKAFVTPGFYAFLAFGRVSGDTDDEYSIYRDISYLNTSASITIDGSNVAQLTVDVADGYRLESFFMKSPTGLFLDWWSDDQKPNSLTAYVTPGTYLASAFVSRPDPEKVGNYTKRWAYGLALGSGDMLQIDPGDNLSYTLGGSFTYDFTILEQELTPQDMLVGEAMFTDAQGNRVTTVALFEEYDGVVPCSIRELVDNRDIFVTAEGHLAVQEREVIAQSNYWPFVYPFLRIYKVDEAAQTETRVFNEYKQMYYNGFSEDIGSLGLGRYRVELAISMGPEGPSATGADEKYYVSIAAAGVPASLDESLGYKCFNTQTVTISGVAAPNSVVEVFVYQGQIGESPSATVTANQYGNFSANVTVAGDGTWSVVARVQGGVLCEPVDINVDTVAPLAPTLQVNLGTDDASVVLAWVGEEGTTALIFRDGAEIAQVSMSQNYTDRTVQRGATYAYTVKLKDRAGNISEPSAEVSVTIPAGLTSATASWQRGISNLGMIGGVVTINASGTAGMTGWAEVSFETEDGVDSELLELTASNQDYTGQHVITAGTLKVLSINVWLERDSSVTPSLDALRGNTITVGGTISGTVHRTNIGNVASVLLSVRPANSNWSIASTSSSGNGSFSFNGLAAGNYTVSVYDPMSGTRPEIQVYVTQGTVTNQADLVLPERHNLSITVVDADNIATKLAGIWVNVNGGTYASGQTNSQGKVTFSSLPPGAYYWSTNGATEHNPAYANSLGSLTVPAQSGEYIIPLTLMSKLVGSISGVITDSSSQPIEGVTVSVYSSTHRSNGGQGSATTAADGSYTISSLIAATDYRVTIAHPDYKTVSIQDQTVVSLQNSELNRSMVRDSIVWGKVYGLKGNGDTVELSGVSVVVGIAGWAQASAITQPDGSYVLRNAPNGNITVSAAANNLGYGQTQHNITVLSEASIERDFYLDELGSIDGHITDSSGNPLQYVYVYSGNRSTRTDSNGYYLLSGVSPGTINLRTVATGYVDQNSQYVVDLGQRVKADFVLNTPGEMQLAFAGQGNRFSANAVEAPPGAVLTLRANYYNKFTTAVDNVQIELDVPTNTTLVPNSILVNGVKTSAVPNGNKLMFNIGTVLGNASGTVVYQVIVDNDIAEELDLLAVAKIRWSVNGNSSEVPLGVCRISVLFTTVSAPAYTADGKVAVFGKSVPGALVHVYDGNRLLGTTAVEGRWWHLNAELTPPALGIDEEEHRIYAVAEKNGLYSNMTQPALVIYKPSAVLIEDIFMNGGWVQNARPNPYIGLVTFGITERQPFSVHVKVNGTVSNMAIVWQGQRYPGVLSVNGYYVMNIPYGWSEYGEQGVALDFSDSAGRQFSVAVGLLTVLIDPSGYVYEAVPSNFLAGVTATVQQYVAGAWVTWDAASFGQVNPQVTDDEGRYGWDVPAGKWRVLFSKDGYETYNSESEWDGEVPPEKTDLNIGLVSTAVPVVESHLPAADAIGIAVTSPMTINFSKHMKTGSLSGNITLTLESDGSSVGGTLAPVSEENSLAKSFTFTPDTELLPNTTYRVTISNGEDYSGRMLTASHSWTFTTGDVAQPGQVQFSSAAYSVGEGDGSVTITVTRTNGTDGTITVDYATSNGTAQAGSDYVAASGTLTFSSGEASKSFNVTITEDTTVEGSETVNLTLSNATGGAIIGSPATATITITDNDSSPIVFVPTTPTTMTGRWITAAGGAVSYAGATVYVLPQALPYGATLNIRLYTPSELSAILAPVRNRLLSDVFDVYIPGTGNFKEHPLSIILPFENLAEDKQPLGYYYDEGKKEWVEVPTLIFEQDGKAYVMLIVEHLTKFAVLSADEGVLGKVHSLKCSDVLSKAQQLDFAPLGVSLEAESDAFKLAKVENSPSAARLELSAMAEQVTIEGELVASYTLDAKVRAGTVSQLESFASPVKWTLSLPEIDHAKYEVKAYRRVEGQWISVEASLDEVTPSLTIVSKELGTYAIVKVAKPQPNVVITLTIGRIDAYVNGTLLTLDAEPFLRPGRTLVPVRFVSEALGAGVEWLEATNQVVITEGDKTIVLTIGSLEVLVNGAKSTIDCAPEIVSARTFVPLRFISEALGAEVDYNEATKTVTIKR